MIPTPFSDPSAMTQADFLKSPFPVACKLPDGPPEGAARFFNREISWLAFNWRVLDEARNPRVPLLERLRFLSISATNLDEFYTVRVAGLRELVREGNTTLSDDGLTASQQLALVNSDARRLMGAQQAVWNGLRRELEMADITILSRSRVTRAEEEFLRRHFVEQVFPVLSPLAIDPAHPFPFIPNAGFSLALELARESDGRRMQALLPIPQQIVRFIPLPGGKRFLRLEDLLLMHLPSLFPGYRDIGHCAFRVLRDSDLEVEEEAEDLVREFETALKRRRRGSVIRLKITAGAPDRLRRLIMEELQVNPEEVVEVEGLLGMADLNELILDSRQPGKGEQASRQATSQRRHGLISSEKWAQHQALQAQRGEVGSAALASAPAGKLARARW